MSIKIVVDVNLTKEWPSFLTAHGFPAINWRDFGNIEATDEEIMLWAMQNAHVVLTNDLDFPRILALTKACGPSLMLLRDGLVIPESSGAMVIDALNRFGSNLSLGALVVIDSRQNRLRLLPL